VIGINIPVLAEYVGDDTTNIYPIPFPVFEYETVDVIIDQDGVETELIPNVDYTLANIDIYGLESSVNLIDNGQAWMDNNTLTAGYTLKVQFSDDVFQPTRLRDLGSFAPVQIEKALDRITMAVKKVAIDLDNISLEVSEDVELIKRYGYLPQIVSAGGTVASVAGRLYVVKIAAAVEIDLPADPQTGDAIHVKRRGVAGSIIIDGNGNTVDGSANKSLPSLESAVSIIWDGEEWLII